MLTSSMTADYVLDFFDVRVGDVSSILAIVAFETLSKLLHRQFELEWSRGRRATRTRALDQLFQLVQNGEVLENGQISPVESFFYDVDQA